MPDYKSMYLTLFNAVTDSITALQTAQAQTEEMYLSGDETAVAIAPIAPKEE